MTETSFPPKSVTAKKLIFEINRIKVVVIDEVIASTVKLADGDLVEQVPTPEGNILLRRVKKVDGL